MKKLLLLLVAILTMSFALSGCSEKVAPLSNVGGDVKSGNGTFAVEKGDYVYFVNGVGDMTASNKMGDVEKGALVRVKTADIGKEGATVETVIPKFVNTGSAVSGIYIYGDVVYYATPYDGKDKTGTVRTDYTDFRTFDLKTGNSTQILYETNAVKDYKFVKNSNGVFLMYDYTTTVDDKEVKNFNVYNMSGSKVFSVEGYNELFTADEGYANATNSDKVFYTKTAYSEELEQDENFTEVYAYTAGASEASVIFSGCGSNALSRDGRNTDEYKAKILKYSDLAGVKVTLIENTGLLLLMKVTANDSNLSSYYLAYEIDKAVNIKAEENANPVELGISNTYLDTAITANAYFKSLDEIYYIENTTNLKGLVKFNYKNVNDFYHGREQICDEADGYNIALWEGEYLYLCGTAGDYYRIKLDGVSELKKINAVTAKSITEWFVPRVINNKLICAYSEAIFQNYLFVVDMANVDSENYEEDYLEKYAELDKDKVLELNKTILGKKTDGDKSSFESLLESTYPEEDEE